jgi:hypothetical protein
MYGRLCIPLQPREDALCVVQTTKKEAKLPFYNPTNDEHEMIFVRVKL